MENGFKPSSFQTLLARLSARSDDSILTSLSTPSRSLGTLGETLKSPESSVSQSSFSPRILSTLPAATSTPFQAPDNSLLPVDEIETKGRVLFQSQSQSPVLSPVLSPVNAVENDVESEDDESLPISTVIPAILAAMQDQTTSPEQKTSLQSLLSDMVKSARQQVEPQAVPGGVDFSQARRTSDGRLCVIKERFLCHDLTPPLSTLDL